MSFYFLFPVPGLAVPQWGQPVQDQQDDADPDVCADPESDPTRSSVPTRPVLQRGGESKSEPSDPSDPSDLTSSETQSTFFSRLQILLPQHGSGDKSDFDLLTHKVIGETRAEAHRSKNCVIFYF